VVTPDDVVPAFTANRGNQSHVQIADLGFWETRARDSLLMAWTSLLLFLATMVVQADSFLEEL